MRGLYLVPFTGLLLNFQEEQQQKVTQYFTGRKQGKFLEENEEDGKKKL